MGKNPRNFFVYLVYFSCMKKISGIFVSLLLAGIAFWGVSAQQDAKVLLDLFSQEFSRMSEKDALKTLQKNRDIVPTYWPFSVMHSFLDDADALTKSLERLRTIPEPMNELGAVSKALFETVDLALVPLQRAKRSLEIFPEIFLSESHRARLERFREKIISWEERLKAVYDFRTTLNALYENESRVMVILQNQNEPRPTGGFMGSLVVFDFQKDRSIDWGFRDIYELDRQVDPDLFEPAPEWFHGLSSVISLRDANFWSDFPTSAEKILRFLRSTDEKTPDILVAVNLNVVRELLRLTGPVTLPKWDIEIDAENIDVVLQFLVEGKVLGRFNVKDPVVLAANEIFSGKNIGRISAEELEGFDWESFLAQENIQAWSKNRRFQRLFDEWGISGRVHVGNDTDDFAQFDFVSVGANKSEKFLWTKVEHNSFVFQDGRIKNRVKIIRNHTLKPGELADLLHTNTWSENLRNLLTEDLLWKIGAGQNRTYIRMRVPEDAKLLSQNNPSGEIQKSQEFFEIPMFVSPGERLEIDFEYETHLKKGSHNWRPYTFELFGSPGKEKSEFLKTISTENLGTFSAETYNIGRPVPLIDQVFKAVVEF